MPLWTPWAARLAYRALVYTAGAYTLDVVVRPAVVARRARAAADRRGKPLINVGAGTARSSLRTLLLGPTLWGDVNVDLAAHPEEACLVPATVESSWGSSPRGVLTRARNARVCRADALALPYADKEFGALLASHVLEHLDDPLAALAEWERVADEVFVVVPKWWDPAAILHPGHRWLFLGSQRRGMRGIRLRRTPDDLDDRKEEDDLDDRKEGGGGIVVGDDLE